MLQGQVLPILLLVVGPVAVEAANLCFLPGGRQVADVPCDLNAKVSMCCGSVAACLSNGLCKDESTTNSTGVSYARGTCTDPTWQSPICPQHCQLNQDTPRNNSAFDFRLNGVQMWQCDAQGYGNPANYCCESASEKTRCCATPSALFKLAAATPGNALAVQNFMTSAPAATTAARATITPQVSPLTTSPRSTTVQKTGTAEPSSTQLAASASSTSGVDQEQDENTLDRNGMIAVGMGAGLGGAVVASIIVVLLVRRMRRKGLQQDDSSVNSSIYYQSFGGGSPGADGKWHKLSRFESAELDNTGATRYWAVADIKDGSEFHQTPTTATTRLGTPTESPVIGHQALYGPPGGAGFGPIKRPMPPSPAILSPKQVIDRNRSIYEMP